MHENLSHSYTRLLVTSYSGNSKFSPLYFDDGLEKQCWAHLFGSVFGYYQHFEGLRMSLVEKNYDSIRASPVIIHC